MLGCTQKKRVESLSYENLEQTRKWINDNFSIERNGKFCGMMSLKNPELFVHKLNKLMFRRNERMKPLKDVIVMHVSGERIKLYSR